MTLNDFRQVILYIKEITQILFHAALTSVEQFATFNASFLAFIVKPLFGLSLIILSTLNLVALYSAIEPTIDLWINAIGSIGNALLQNISILGWVCSKVFDFSFSAGPSFFVGALLVAAIHQLTLMGLNLHRAAQHPSGSEPYYQFLQDAVFNAIMAAQASASIGAAIVVMFISVSMPSAFICASSVISIVLCNRIWRLLPNELQHTIKSSLYLEKPSIEDSTSNDASGVSSFGVFSMQHTQTKDILMLSPAFRV